MPAVVPAVYLTNPVIVSATEVEDGVPTYTVDSNTTIPVVVLGMVPAVGAYLIAYHLQNRWVAELGSAERVAYSDCTPCNLPQVNLTLSWTNGLTGNGFAMMTWTSGPNNWQTVCVDEGLQFILACTLGGIELGAVFWTEGLCPTGISNHCSNLRAAPLTLNLASSTCSPLTLVFNVTEDGCPTVYGLGNTQFVITL
jgi:hypothetical protein